MPEEVRSLMISAGIGVVAGMRSMSALALIGDRIAPRKTAAVLKLMALAEMIADKTPAIPPRTEPMPLAGRIAIGGVAAGTIARHLGGSIAAAAVVGATAAAASTHLFYRLRSWAGSATNLPDPVFGAAEDGMVLALATGLANRIPQK